MLTVSACLSKCPGWTQNQANLPIPDLSFLPYDMAKEKWIVLFWLFSNLGLQSVLIDHRLSHNRNLRLYHLSMCSTLSHLCEAWYLLAIYVIYTIILLKSVCLSVTVSKLQVAILARSSREMPQTVRI